MEHGSSYGVSYGVLSAARKLHEASTAGLVVALVFSMIVALPAGAQPDPYGQVLPRDQPRPGDGMVPSDGVAPDLGITAAERMIQRMAPGNPTNPVPDRRLPATGEFTVGMLLVALVAGGTAALLGARRRRQAPTGAGA